VAIDAQNPHHAELAEAAQVLRAGGLVAFPTETVYGLGANALDAEAVRGIFQAKGRPSGNPLIIHVSDHAMLRLVVANWTATAQKLADRFCPGPLTFVLPKTSLVPDVVTGGGPTVAVRMPKHLVALGLIRAAGFPLAAPSANRSTELSPTRAEHVFEALAGRIDMILDGGPTLDGIESTVLDLTTDPPTLLRPGPIAIADIEAIVGPIRRKQTVHAERPFPSPGMMARHYSPRTPVELFDNRDLLLDREEALRGSGEAVANLVFEGTKATTPPDVAMPGTPGAYAARLYHVLHELDHRGLSRILIELPPDTEEWLAVRDRLTRAVH
jgi:L-threonylcarbamoyladenylate synthase